MELFIWSKAVVSAPRNLPFSALVTLKLRFLRRPGGRNCCSVRSERGKKKKWSINLSRRSWRKRRWLGSWEPAPEGRQCRERDPTAPPPSPLPALGQLTHTWSKLHPELARTSSWWSRTVTDCRGNVLKKRKSVKRCKNTYRFLPKVVFSSKSPLVLASHYGLTRYQEHTKRKTNQKQNIHLEKNVFCFLLYLALNKTKPSKLILTLVEPPVCLKRS